MGFCKHQFLSSFLVDTSACWGQVGTISMVSSNLQVAPHKTLSLISSFRSSPTIPAGCASVGFLLSLPYSYITFGVLLAERACSFVKVNSLNMYFYGFLFPW